MASFHLETAANLLISLQGIFGVFSKCVLKSLDNQTDFDSAIRRFESSRPSQPVPSLWHMSGSQEYSPNSRGLARMSSVSEVRFFGFSAGRRQFLTRVSGQQFSISVLQRRDAVRISARLVRYCETNVVLPIPDLRIRYLSPIELTDVLGSSIKFAARRFGCLFGIFQCVHPESALQLHPFPTVCVLYFG
jgi:hypothetical protein